MMCFRCTYLPVSSNLNTYSTSYLYIYIYFFPHMYVVHRINHVHNMAHIENTKLYIHYLWIKPPCNKSRHSIIYMGCESSTKDFKEDQFMAPYIHTYLRSYKKGGKRTEQGKNWRLYQEVYNHESWIKKGPVYILISCLVYV